MSDPAYRCRRGVAVFLEGERTIEVVEGRSYLTVPVTAEELRWLMDHGFISGDPSPYDDPAGGPRPPRPGRYSGVRPPGGRLRRLK